MTVREGACTAIQERTYTAKEDKAPIYLTFDDGPHPVFTPLILDVLQFRGIYATFFVIGSKLCSRPLAEIVVRTASEGHTVGNHTFSHAALVKHSALKVREEINKTDFHLRSLGIRSRLLRPPYGSINRGIAEIAQQLGYELCLWDNDPCDWKSCQPESAWVDNALDAVDKRNAHVILCHDNHQRTVDHLGRLIQELATRGFGFSTLGAIQPVADSRPPLYRFEKPRL